MRRAGRLVAAAGALLLGGLGTLGAAPAAVAAPGPASSPEYYFDGWDVPALWAAGARGQGVVIAELDTGVAGDLPELADRVLPGADFGTAGGDGRVDRDGDPFGHGTAMASLMVAHPGTFDVTGLAPDAQVLPVALPLVGTSDQRDDDQLPEAIRWAADHGARIISMSLGEARTPGPSGSAPCPDAEQQAIFHALAKGAVLVAASGNAGQSGSPVVDPGVCLGVVSVGAVDRTGTVAPFSSQHRYLTTTAPGVDVPSLSRVPGRAYAGDGTSQATAIAAAALALGWSAHPELSGRQLVTRLLATVQPGPGQAPGTHSAAYGYGRLDAAALVRADVPADAANPVYATADPFLARYQAGLTTTALAVPSALPPLPDVASLPVGHAPGRFTDRFRAAVGAAAGGLGVAVLALLLRRRWAPGVGPTD